MALALIPSSTSQIFHPFSVVSRLAILNTNRKIGEDMQQGWLQKEHHDNKLIHIYT